MQTYLNLKRRLIPISAFLIFMLQLLSTFTPVSAQTAEEKNFLLMYFKEEELVVESSTRSSKSVSQVAENVTVITASEIELMNAHTLAEVLNTVTGVEMWMTGGPGQIASGNIQGSVRVTAMIDGVVLNNLSDNVVDFGMIPVQMIEKIEIIKGPASSAWGSAMGGVVNVITKKGGLDQQGDMASVSYGNNNSGDFRVETMGKQSKLGYYLTAGRLQSDGLAPHFKVNDNNAYTKLTYDLTDNTNILFSFGYDKNARETGLDPTWYQPNKNDYEILHSTLAINSALNKNAELTLSLRMLNQDALSSYYDYVTGAPVQDNYRDKGYGSSAKLTWKDSYQTIVLGADYDSKTFESNTITTEQGLRTSALYLNDTLSIGKLAITPGVRFDTSNSNGDVTSPSLGITYCLANTTTLRAFAADGFNMPPLMSTYGNTSYYTANPELKVEKVHSYQAGIETAALHYVWFKLSLVRDEIRDAINIVSTPQGFLKAENTIRERFQGAEFDMRTLPVYHISLTAGAEFIDAKDLDSRDRLTGIPTKVFDLGLLYNDEDSFKAVLKGRHIDWNAEPFYQGSYSSFIFDLNMIKKIHQQRDASSEAFLNVHNISNSSQYLYFRYPNPERWFEGGIRYTF